MTLESLLCKWFLFIHPFIYSLSPFGCLLRVRNVWNLWNNYTISNSNLIPFSFHFRSFYIRQLNHFFFLCFYSRHSTETVMNSRLFCGWILINIIISTLFQMPLYWIANFPSLWNILKLFEFNFFSSSSKLFGQNGFCVLLMFQFQFKLLMHFSMHVACWCMTIYIQFSFWVSVFIKSWQCESSDNKSFAFMDVSIKWRVITIIRSSSSFKLHLEDFEKKNLQYENS